MVWQRQLLYVIVTIPLNKLSYSWNLKKQTSKKQPKKTKTNKPITSLTVWQLTRKTSHLLKAGMPVVTDDTGKGYKLRSANQKRGQGQSPGKVPKGNLPLLSLHRIRMHYSGGIHVQQPSSHTANQEHSLSLNAQFFGGSIMQAWLMAHATHLSPISTGYDPKPPSHITLLVFLACLMLMCDDPSP